MTRDNATQQSACSSRLWIDYFYKICFICVCACACVCVAMGTYGGWKVASDPLELELQVFVRHLIRAVGSELWTSDRAISALNHPVSVQLLNCTL